MSNFAVIPTESIYPIYDFNITASIFSNLLAYLIRKRGNCGLRLVMHESEINNR